MTNFSFVDYVDFFVPDNLAYNALLILAMVALKVTNSLIDLRGSLVIDALHFLPHQMEDTKDGVIFTPLALIFMFIVRITRGWVTRFQFLSSTVELILLHHYQMHSPSGGW